MRNKRDAMQMQTSHFRPQAVDYEIATDERWAYALDLGTDLDATAALTFDPMPSPGWSAALPFDTENYPFSVRARARALPDTTWGYYGASNITAQPPPSPLDCARAACGKSESVRLVPFGGTNIRIAVMPWV